MQKREFTDMGAFEDVKNGLARASRHPIHVDLGDGYREGGVEPLTQSELGDDRDDVVDRLDRVRPQDDLHVVWNNRDDRRAYVGSDRYNLIQHREVLDAIETAVGRTTGSIEKGVVRDYGEHVDGVLVFGDREEATVDVFDLIDEDAYVPPEGSDYVRDVLGLGMRFHNSFNGRSGYGATTMAYRYVCQNWMVWGEEEIASRDSYHIKGGDEAPGVDPDYFESVIGTVFEQRDPLADIVKESYEDGEMPRSWVPGVLAKAGFGRNYQKRITSRLLQQMDRSEDRTTLWALYNAATHHIDHDRIDDLGPERYDHHQACAWNLLEMDVEAPDAEVDELREFAAGVTTA